MKKILTIIRYVFGIMFILVAFAGITKSISTYLFFALISGILLLPCLYEFSRKKISKGNDKIWFWAQIILPLIFIILFGVFTPVYVKIGESTGGCEYVKQFDVENGNVYFYCLDKVEIRQDDDTYLLLKDMYNKDVNTIDTLISKLETKYEYEDNSVLYNDSYYSILKCANGDFVFGNSSMTFEKGFCGVEDIPNIKEDNLPQNNDNNNEEVPEENNKPVEKPHENNKPIEKQEYDIEISLKEMADVYYNNELNGNKQFFGKRVKTKAKFRETSSGMFSGLIAYFDGGNAIYDIHCTSFDKETEGKLSELNRNETVNIIGTVGELISPSINFKNCKIYK